MSWLGGIDHTVVEQLARLVQHRHLAAGAVTRVERDDTGTAHGTGREQALDVLGKDLDGVRLGAHGEARADLALERGRHQALVAVRDGRLKDRRKDTLAARPASTEARHRRRVVHTHAHAELLLALAAVDGKDAVVGNLGRGLGEVVIGFVGSLLACVHRHGDDVRRGFREGAQVGHVLGVLRHHLGHDVRRTGERLLRRVKAGLGGLRRHKARRLVERRALGCHLHEDHVGKWLQASLARLLRARHALLAIGLVEVLHALELCSRLDLCLELRRELALGLDEEKDVCLALLEISQVRKALVKGTQGNVVHAARGLLAVARNEGNGVSLVDELYGRLDGLRLEIELACECGDKVHVTATPNGCVQESPSIPEPRDNEDRFNCHILTRGTKRRAPGTRVAATPTGNKYHRQRKPPNGSIA